MEVIINLMDHNNFKHQRILVKNHHKIIKIIKIQQKIQKNNSLKRFNKNINKEIKRNLKNYKNIYNNKMKIKDK